MGYYERIEKCAKEKGLSIRKLALATGIEPASFSQWKKGIYRPTLEALQKISSFLDVSTDYLINGNEKQSENLIPILGTVPCGTPLEAIEDVIEWIEVVPSQKDCFALIAKGDSMSPYIMDGDILIVKPNNEVNNKIGIVKVNGDEATCKKIIINNGITLMPMNVSYNAVSYSPEQVASLPVKIIGEVKEIRRRFK